MTSISSSSFICSSPLFSAAGFAHDGPHSPPSSITYRPLRVSASCTSTVDRPRTRTGSSSSLYEVLGIHTDATCQEIKSLSQQAARGKRGSDGSSGTPSCKAMADAAAAFLYLPSSSLLAFTSTPRPPCSPLGYGPLLLLHPSNQTHSQVASLDHDVLDALILVKKFGPDVREGKRRQFNYIGKMLRDVEPDLMDALIQATKDSDESKLQALSGPETLSIDDNEEQEEEEETDYEEEEEGSHIDVATRWFDGLINKDIQITNEVYSISNVEFDRQELRKLVRRVHSVLEDKVNSEENGGAKDAVRVSAEKSLTRFLRSLAKSSLLIDV
ncbi:uncharacterized protein Pyn_14928 [Prunus yedoensis var. nudiflora]|uniref:J domain-containing protein n=1 Tax=Prunus yedoensis var. nudiflora TaxID=2094558 RepID=A0A314ZX79_PRUYE|nr:uncharacterized protein Pyn_14928 [Prunus yedoensis var. nudiflora]